ncbi:MAG: ankyrin repeat domain-containing protein [Nitrospira sp.]|nr:ankyrin repeat domain-containing protein [Nitrospira sp.]
MELGKESKMVRVALTVLLVFVFCGPATAQDLPPEILADQYMMEGVTALENGEGKQAIEVFRKIEAMDTELPASFRFFYGKALVENSAVFGDLLKGHKLLQQFKAAAGRDSPHYDTALRLLSDVGRKLLPAAVAQGRAEAVQALIVSGSNVNARNEKGCTILCLAVQEGHSDIVQVLLDAGADISSRNEKGCTALCLAVQGGHSDIVQVLLDAGADISSLEKKDGMQTIEAFRKIEALGTELPVEFQFFYGKALIRHSAASNSEDLLKGQSLIKQFVVDTGRDSEQYAAALRLLSVAGRRLLFAAVANGRAEAVRAFIAAGATVNAKDASGDTLLHKAIDVGHAEIAQALIAAGADVNAKDASGDTPLRKAIDVGRAEIAQALIAAGAE